MFCAVAKSTATTGCLPAESWSWSCPSWAMTFWEIPNTTAMVQQKEARV
ncbi:hypothetical protein RMSM_00123 [Rhodopirellula maiorica SM1]|uniref:Uncharacterized protein n=1 Tax=Rhodopirellula maiorica SM1 TaxID=1265738 RepID=M5S9T9_9BACT|nr:hypothetical protein RMSM_00123 [Rhodopirellula maiorica SM1]